jgi:hypothetical protein
MRALPEALITSCQGDFAVFSVTFYARWRGHILRRSQFRRSGDVQHELAVPGQRNPTARVDRRFRFCGPLRYFGNVKTRSYSEVAEELLIVTPPRRYGAESIGWSGGWLPFFFLPDPG